MSIYQFLLSANNQSSNGSLFNGNSTKLNQANSIFDAINNQGDI